MLGPKGFGKRAETSQASAMNVIAQKTFARGRFQVQRVLGEGGMGVVYDVLDTERDMRVALKKLRLVNLETLYYFKEEFRSLHDLMHPNLCSLMELIEDDGTWLLTMELIHGRSFLSHVENAGNPVFDEARLRQSLAGLFEGLHILHCSGKVHRDIKPSNVLVTDEGRVVLLDFGLISESEIDLYTESGAIIGTAEYMSPEQANGDVVGPEADWYAVGVMLYEALTGTLPFSGPPMKILLEKQTADPPNPREKTPGLPEDLATLCSALLSRDPELRPNSGDIAQVVLAAHSEPTRAVATGIRNATHQLLFVGRQDEIDHLENTYQKMNEGSFQAVVIEGVSGVGKSSLVRHFISSLPSDAAPVVLRGRCYERETTPFKAFDGVIDSLVRHAKTGFFEGALAIETIDAQLLTRLFPALKSTALLQESRQTLNMIDDPRELQNRAFDAFKKLFALLSSQHPVIVVIDDLQWIDADSIQLLRHLTGGLKLPEILVLLTARYSSDKGTSVLNWDELISRNLSRVGLKALSTEESLELAQLVLEKEHISVNIEATQVAKEAAGHPLYIAELIQHIAGGGKAWQNLRLDDVIWNRIEALPPVTRRLLETICVLGTPFQKDNLQSLAFLGSEDFYKGIAQLTAGHLIRSEGPRKDHRIETYHDRVREAVLEHLETERSTKIHLNIGWFLLTIYSDSDLQDNVFEVVRHLEAGSGMITKSSEKRLLAELYFQAGKRSHESAAYTSSLTFFKKSIALFPKDGWQSHYRTMLELYSIAAEAAYIEGDLSLTKKLVKTSDAKARSDLDRVPIWKTYVASLVSEGKPIEGIDETIKMVQQLGVKLPYRPSRLHVWWKTVTMRIRLLGKTTEQLVNLPHTTDPYTIAVRRLLSTSGTVAHLLLPDVWVSMTIKLVELSLEFGIDHLSAVSFTNWAMVNCGALRKYKAGYKFGTVSLGIMDQFDGNSQNALAIHYFANFIQHWIDHLRETLPHLKKSHELARKTGDTFNLAYTGTHFCYHSFYTGVSLPELAETCREYNKIIDYKKQTQASLRNRILHQTVLNLMGQSKDPVTISQTPYGDTDNVSFLLRSEDDLNIFNYLSCKLFLQLYFGRYADAHSTALRAQKCVARGTYLDAVMPFYDSLTCLKLSSEVDVGSQKELLRRVAANQKKYRKTARSSSSNHEHKYTLVEALRAQIKNRYKISAALYGEAIKGALKNQFIQDAALACELQAEHYQQIDEREKARSCVLQAIAHYEKWGATAKVEQLITAFEH